MIKYFIFIILTSIFIIAGCNVPHGILYLENNDNGQQIKISLSEEIIISLDANPTAGYTWAISNIDSDIIRQVQEVEFKANSQKLGAPGKQIFHFQAVSVGQTELKLVYHRPWEKEVAPLDMFYIKISVTR